MRTECSSRRQFPRTSAKTKSAVVSAPTGQMSVVLPPVTIESGVRHRDNLEVTTTIVECNHRIISDFRLEARAASALNAAFAVEVDQLAKRNTFLSF